jgi:hypothetical protein
MLLPSKAGPWTGLAEVGSLMTNQSINTLSVAEFFLDLGTGEPVSVNYDVRCDLDANGRPYANGSSRPKVALKRERRRVRELLRGFGLAPVHYA